MEDLLLSALICPLFHLRILFNPTLSYSLEEFVLLISSQLPPHAEALEAAYGILTVLPSPTLS